MSITQTEDNENLDPGLRHTLQSHWLKLLM